MKNKTHRILTITIAEALYFIGMIVCFIIIWEITGLTPENWKFYVVLLTIIILIILNNFRGFWFFKPKMEMENKTLKIIKDRIKFWKTQPEVSYDIDKENKGRLQELYTLENLLRISMRGLNETY